VSDEIGILFSVILGQDRIDNHA